MNTKSKVTILIVSYNEKEYLPRAIESCINQTYENKEIIIGDDGSDDGSIDFIKNYKGISHYYIMPRLEKEIIPSLRVSEVIKRGFRESDGDYYVILSGDDFFVDNNMLSEAVDFLDNNPEYFTFVNGYKTVTDDTEINVRIPRNYKPDVYWSAEYLHISCFIFRRLGDSDLLNRFCDDIGLEYILALKGDWKYNNKVTFAYYQRKKSIMHKLDKLELSIVEMMIFQDIMNYEKITSRPLIKSSFSRFFYHYYFIMVHRKNLINEKYNKYINSCQKYENDYISLILYRKNIIKLITIFIKMLLMKLLYIIRRRVFYFLLKAN